MILIYFECKSFIHSFIMSSSSSKHENDADDDGSQPQPKRPSQFAGAAALFRQHESDLQQKQQQQLENAKSKQKPKKKRPSQFASAAAMFQQNTSNTSNSNLELDDSLRALDFADDIPITPKSYNNSNKRSSAMELFAHKANASVGNVFASTNNPLVSPPTTVKQKTKQNATSSTATLPSFVSPGVTSGRAVVVSEAEKAEGKSWNHQKKYRHSISMPNQLPLSSSPGTGAKPVITTSYLNKGTDAATTPKNNHKSKVDPHRFVATSSYIGKGSDAQHTTTPKQQPKQRFSSPMAALRSKMKQPPPQHKAMALPHVKPEYLYHKSRSSKHRKSEASTPLQPIADVPVVTTSSTLKPKSKPKLAHERLEDDDKVPEAIQKYRKREAARLQALQQQQRQAEQVIAATMLGWYHRQYKWPTLKQQLLHHQQRRHQLQQERQRQHDACTKLQALVRAYGPRKEYHRKRAILRRRRANQARIQHIQTELLPLVQKTTKVELKQLAKHAKAQKKQLKQQLRDELQQEQEKLDAVRRQGRDAIQYLQDENRKVRDQLTILTKDKETLEKQHTFLQQHASEIQERTDSLKAYITKKEGQIQRRTISSHKCRHRYLPKYRAELVDRNQYCIAEYRVKQLYHQRLYSLVDQIRVQCQDESLIEECVQALIDLEDELANEIPHVPIPEGLLPWLQPKENDSDDDSDSSSSSEEEEDSQDEGDAKK